MNPKEKTKEAIDKKEEQKRKNIEFYRKEMEWMVPMRDYLQCQVEIMKLGMIHDNLVAERQDLESRMKKEK
jgi:hypothetical protein